MSRKAMYVPKPVDYREKDWKKVMKMYDENMERLEACDKKARDAGKIVGRYIQHPYADGHAVYQIVRENKHTVRIRVCTGLGDDWILPAWGEECTIDKATAMQFLSIRDNWVKFFGEKMYDVGEE